MSIVPYGETCAAFCFLEFYLMLSSVFRLLRLYRHLIIALHGHQLMQAVAFLAVIVVTLVFLGYEGLNLCNDFFTLRKLLGCAQLVKLALGSFVDDKICFVGSVELFLVLLPADAAVLFDRVLFCSVIVCEILCHLNMQFLSENQEISLKKYL